MPDALQVPPQTCPACGTAVDVSEAEPLAKIACPQCGEKFRVETAFDNFKLTETLGVGGMGSVYKAQDTRLGRFVALKLLRKDLSADPAEAARLEQEARVTAAINHPNVVQLYSSGTAHGQIYLVMELVDHGSLDDLMAQHARVPERQVLETGIQVARGLEAAHEKGLIHRDVKPANILFSDARTAKIGDFGLAGAAEQHAEAQQEIWGTPYYVAPERLDNAPEDFRSDIYSLGATLFHALAGRPPMEAETTSAAELRRLKSAPPSLRSLAPEVSKETALVIDRMLRPDPANRFTSYAHLVDELRRAWRALPADGSAPAERSWLKPMVIGLVSLALLAGAAAIIGFIASRRPRPPRWRRARPLPGADNSTALQQRYEEARRQLLDGKLEAATASFTKLIKEAGDRQPLQNWARLHLGLAQMLQAKIAPARDSFEQLQRSAAFSAKPAESDLPRFFTETARALAGSGPVRGAAEAEATGWNSFALFLYGVKDWQLREFDEAAAYLRKFAESDAA